MSKIKVSAPGKLMLLGEHAVLYNHPCLVTAVDKRMRVTVGFTSKAVFELQAPDVQIADYKKPMNKLGHGEIPKEAKFVEIAVKNILRHSGQDGYRTAQHHSVRASPEPTGSGTVTRQARMTGGGLRVRTKSEFSPEYGFGSSSAVTVCITKAISELFNLNLSNKEIFDLSYKTVLDIQGKGSGFDIAAAIYGGTIYFQTGGMKTQHLDIESLPLVVGYSGEKADTVTVVNNVKKNFKNKKRRLDEICNEIGILVDQGKETLVKKNWRRLGEFMNRNQEYLGELGVSTYRLDRMIRSAINAGAYGAKLSGAGGGDCMIALASDENRKKVCEAIKNTGGEIINVKTAAEGARIEKS